MLTAILDTYLKARGGHYPLPVASKYPYLWAWDGTLLMTWLGSWLKSRLGAKWDIIYRYWGGTSLGVWNKAWPWKAWSSSAPSSPIPVLGDYRDQKIDPNLQTASWCGCRLSILFAETYHRNPQTHIWHTVYECDARQLGVDASCSKNFLLMVDDTVAWSLGDDMRSRSRFRVSLLLLEQDTTTHRHSYCPCLIYLSLDFGSRPACLRASSCTHSSHNLIPSFS